MNFDENSKHGQPVCVFIHNRCCFEIHFVSSFIPMSYIYCKTFVATQILEFNSEKTLFSFEWNVVFGSPSAPSSLFIIYDKNCICVCVCHWKCMSKYLLICTPTSSTTITTKKQLPLFHLNKLFYYHRIQSCMSIDGFLCQQIVHFRFKNVVKTIKNHLFPFTGVFF